MIPINNSDTAWLIVSDYNQENDLSYEDLREDVLDPDTGQQFCWEPRCYGVGDTRNCGDRAGNKGEIGVGDTCRNSMDGFILNGVGADTGVGCNCSDSSDVGGGYFHDPH